MSQDTPRPEFQIVPFEDLERLEKGVGAGLLGVVGVFDDAPEYADHLNEVVGSRAGQESREAPRVGLGGAAFVGRRKELARLAELVPQMQAGGSACGVLVAGEAGVGKTRLIEAFAEQCRASGVMVLVGGCLAASEGWPYAPVVEALQGLRHRLDVGVFDEAVGSAGPELSSLVNQGKADEGDLNRGRLMAAVRRLIQGLTCEVPIVLIVEDLQWADQSTRELLTFLLGQREPLGLLFVGTYRSDELHPGHQLRLWAAELRRSRCVSQLEVQRFTRDEVAHQLHAITGSLPDAAIADEVYERSDGNAFFVEELASALHHGSELPTTLRDLLLARVEELGEQAREVLRAAAVAGRRVDHDLLAAVAELSERQLGAALREAVEAHVLISHNGGYRFRHALTQEAVYADLLPGERAALHGAFAARLEKLMLETRVTRDMTVEVAHHWYAADDLPIALEATVAAAATVELAYGWPEALRLWERAIEIWDRMPDGRKVGSFDRAGLHERAAEAAAKSGAATQAAALVGGALKLVDSDQQPVRAGLLWERLGRYRWMSSQPDATKACAEAVGLVPPEPPTPERALVLASLGHALMLASRYGESQRWCEEAVVVAIEARTPAIEGRARGALGVDVALLGDVDAGVAQLLAARRLAEESGGDEERLRCYVNLSAVYADVAQFARTVEVALEGLRVATELGLEAFAGKFLQLSAAEALWHLGRWDEAQRLADDIDPSETGGVDAVFLHTLKAELATSRGEYTAARRHLAELYLRAELGDPQMAVPRHTAVAQLAVSEGRLEDARAAVAEGLRALSGVDDEWLLGERLHGLALRVEADQATRSPDLTAVDEAATRHLLDQARVFAARAKSRSPLRVIPMWEAEWARLRRSDTAETWAATAEMWRHRAMPLQVSYSLWRQTQAFIARGQRSAAMQRVLGEAQSLAAQLGARPLLDELRGLTPPEQPLTRRERQVIGLLVEGLSNRHIARALGISEKTASVHVSNILTKLKVRSRAEAAVKAARLHRQ